MKKLAFTVTTDLNHDQRMQRICGSLARNGYKVELIGREKENSRPLIAKPYKQHRLQCTFNKGKLFYLEYMLRLFFYLQKNKYNAVCAIDLDSALPVYFHSKIKRNVFVHDAHEYFPEVVEVTDRKLVKKAWEGIEGFILNRTRYGYTVTQSIAAIFFKKYGAKFEVIRNMPLLQSQNEHINREPNTILYQGAVNEGRGLEVLLQAVVNLDAKLVICGEGDVLPKLKAMTSELGIEQKVVFTGQLLPNELWEYTKRCTVGVMLLENRGLSYYYSLANKFFDYIQAELPQLVIDFPEYRQLNDQYEVGLVCELEVEEVRSKLRRLLTDAELYNKLKQNCAIAKQELNWEQEEKRLLAFYNNIWEA